MHASERQLLRRLSTELDSLSTELVEVLLHVDALGRDQTLPLPPRLREVFSRALHATAGAVNAIQRLEVAELERLAS